MKRRGNWINFGVGSVLRRIDIYDEIHWREVSQQFSKTHHDNNNNNKPDDSELYNDADDNNDNDGANAHHHNNSTAVSFDRDTLAAAAPQGGPVMRVNTDTSCLDVYTASGRKIAQLHIPNEARTSLHQIGWSSEEAPLLVSLGSNNHPPMFLLGDIAKQTFEKFKCAEPGKYVSGNPVAGIVRPFGCYYIFKAEEDTPGSPSNLVLQALLLPDNLFDPVTHQTHNISEHLIGVTAIEAIAKADQDNNCNHLYVCGYAATYENMRLKPSERRAEIFTIDCETGDVDLRPVTLPARCYATQISLSPDALRFAMLFQEGTIWITTSDLNTVEMEIKLGITAPPVRFQWCGDSFVHLLFEADKFQDNQNQFGIEDSSNNNNNNTSKFSDNEEDENNNNNNNFENANNNDATNKEDEEDEYICPCHWSLIVPAPKNELFLKQQHLQSSALAGMLPKFELVKWDLDSPSGYVLTTTEIDGLRVVTESSNILFESVPTCLESACHLRAGTVASSLCRAIQDLHDAGGSLLDSAVKLDHLLNNKTIDALNGVGLIPHPLLLEMNNNNSDNHQSGGGSNEFDNEDHHHENNNNNAASTTTKKKKGKHSSSMIGGKHGSGNSHNDGKQTMTGNAVPGAATTLSDVLEELLDAACAEFDPLGQAAFLKIVSEMTLLLSRNKYSTIAISSGADEGTGGGGGGSSNAPTYHYNKFINTSMTYTGIEAEVMKDVTRRLRMLNDIRNHHGAGMPITLRQYQFLTGSNERTFLNSNEARPVIHRLIHHRDFIHAARLAHFFGTKLESVAMQWAISKVQQNGSSTANNTATHRLISRVMRNFPAVDAVDIATAAVQCGNTPLAVDLLQSDNSSTAEVLFLLQLNHPTLAVEKALGSDDTELVSEILIKLMSPSSGKGELYAALMRYPEASHSIFMTACHFIPGKENLCRDFCENARLDLDFAFRQLLTKHFRNGLKENALLASNLRVEKLDAVTAHEKKSVKIKVERRKEGDEADGDGASKKGAEYYSEEIDAPCNPDVEQRIFEPFDPRNAMSAAASQVGLEVAAELQALAVQSGDDAASKALTQHMYLTTQQERLAAENDNDPDLVGMPVSQTLRWMYKHCEDYAADELVQKLGVSERAHVLARLDAWVEMDRWDLIDGIAGTTGTGASSGKKSSSSTKDLPSGCLILFIEAAHKAGQQARAVQLVTKLTSLAEKVEWLVQLDEFQRAADACYDDSNIGMLQQLRKKSQNPQMQKYIEGKITKLS